MRKELINMTLADWLIDSGYVAARVQRIYRVRIYWGRHMIDQAMLLVDAVSLAWLKRRL